jgi:predicted amidophosphoribosyltransferase
VTAARFIDDVLAAVLPGTCPCGARGEPCCAECAAALLPAPIAAPPPGIDWWVAPFAYAGVARELVARAKYRAVRAPIAWLAAAVAERVPSAHALDVVTWVPASRRRLQERGVDHGELLARGVARRLHVPARRLLRRAPGTPQTGAAHADRRTGPRLERTRAAVGLHILVVDDVATTGASLAVAAATLRAAGARSVAAATATRTPPPGHR